MPLSEMSFQDRRRSERLPVVIDVVITHDGHRQPAELRDVSGSGVGLVVTGNSALLKNDGAAVVEFQSTSLAVASLSGKLRTNSDPIAYRPNVRSAGFHVDAAHVDSLTMIMRSCAGEEGIPTAEVGFLRAWNMLDMTERKILKASFESLQVMDANAARVAENLVKDPNCSASRLLRLMRVFLRGVEANSGVTTFDVLEEAFVAYKLQHSLEDIQKDRLIKYELGSSRLASVQA